MANTQIEKRFLKEEEKLMNALEDTDLIWELDTKEPITLTIKTDKKLIIEDSLLSKIKNIAKKLHYYYLWLVYTEDEKKRRETNN